MSAPTPRNGHLDFAIPYGFLGQHRFCIFDFLVDLADGTTLIPEIKGYQDEEDREEHTAAWKVEAVNNWGGGGLRFGGKRGTALHAALGRCADPLSRTVTCEYRLDPRQAKTRSSGVGSQSS